MKFILVTFSLTIGFTQYLLADTITCFSTLDDTSNYKATFKTGESNSVALEIRRDDSSVIKFQSTAFPGQTGTTFPPPVLSSHVKYDSKTDFYVNLWRGSPNSATIQPHTAISLGETIFLKCDH